MTEGKETATAQGAVCPAPPIAAPLVLDDVTSPNTLQREVWLRDPDGYLVALAGLSDYRPRVWTASPSVRRAAWRACLS